MTKIDFYFIRHGYSCANILKHESLRKYILYYKSKYLKDPHLTVWGIISSVIAGIIINTTVFKDINFDYKYCSPLIRTWETAACMFADRYNDFRVAPYLREGRPNVTPQKKEMLLGESDNPYSYEDNLVRFNQFKLYLSSGNHKNIRYILDELNSKLIDKVIDDTKKFKVDPSEHRNVKTNTLKGDIKLFISWFIEKHQLSNHAKNNVLVVAHGSLILNNFIKEYDKDFYQRIKSVHKNNNFCFKVSVVDNKITKIDSIFQGIKPPAVKELKDFLTKCSLCSEKKKCSDKLLLRDKEKHIDLFRNLIKNIIL